MPINKKKHFGQFDTPVALAQHLYAQLEFQHDYFIDFGAGTGNLSDAVPGMGIQIEIDPERIKQINTRPQVNIQQADILDPEFDIYPFIRHYSRRLFISNPPFAKTSRPARFGFFQQRPGKDGAEQIDVIFLDKIMQQMRKQDALLLIISAPFLELDQYREQRQQFFQAFNDVAVYSLPIKTFKTAEVQAYAILAKNQSSTAQPVRMLQINSDLGTRDEFLLCRSQLKGNLNFKFQRNAEQISRLHSGDTLTLGQLNPVMFRGNKIKKDQAYVLHTSDLTNERIQLPDTEIPAHYRIAKAGDILVARVGNIIGRCALITQGQCALTDVVICLRVPPGDLERVWQSIHSDTGRQWLRHHAQGKCAKYITYLTLKQLPVKPALPDHLDPDSTPNTA